MLGSLILGGLFGLALTAGYLLGKQETSKKKHGKVKPYAGRYLFCPGCGNQLVKKDVEGKLRKTCESCGFVHWNNPLPVAVILIPHRDGGFVFVKRKKNPRAGYFALPGGYVDPYESALAAAIREAKEETGLDIVIDRLLFTSAPEGVNEVLLFFLAKTAFEQPVGGDDAELCVVSSLNSLPGLLAFETHRQAINDYMHGSPRA